MRVRRVKATRTHPWLLVPREIRGRRDCFLVHTRLILSIHDDGHGLRDNCIDIETGGVVVVRGSVINIALI